MLTISIHIVAWVCIVLGIFLFGMLFGYKLAEGTPSASDNSASTPCLHVFDTFDLTKAVCVKCGQMFPVVAGKAQHAGG